MFFVSHTNQQMRKSRRAVAKIGLSLSLSLVLIGQCALTIAAYAQGAGPDQDSLLPPEVVPLEPAAASSLAQSQAASHQSSMNSMSAPSNPVSQSMPSTIGAPPANPQGEMQSAQDFRKAAFNSLYGTGQFPPQNPNLQSMNGQMGQLPGQPGMTGMPGPGQNPALNPAMNPGLQANQQAGGMQSQTLCGQVSQPATNQKQSQTSKISHAVSVGTSLGGLGLMSGAMSGNPMSFFGVGLMGVGLLNYGLRGGKF